MFSEHVNYSPERGLGLPLQAIGSDEGRVPVGHHVLSGLWAGQTGGMAKERWQFEDTSEGTEVRSSRNLSNSGDLSA